MIPRCNGVVLECNVLKSERERTAIVFAYNTVHTYERKGRSQLTFGLLVPSNGRASRREWFRGVLELEVEVGMRLCRNSISEVVTELRELFQLEACGRQCHHQSPSSILSCVILLALFLHLSAFHPKDAFSSPPA